MENGRKLKLSSRNFEHWKYLVLDWADERNLLKYENIKTQALKTVSEVGELADAVIRNNTDEVRDAIGDTIVTLIILAEQQGLDIVECLESAYNEIKDRTGKTVNGTFIKDSKQ